MPTHTPACPVAPLAHWPAGPGMRPAGHDMRGHRMTLLWFIAWIITNGFITESPIQFDPVNVWATLLLLAIAIDLAGAQAKGWSKR